VGAAVVGAAEKYADTPPLRLLLQLLVPESMCRLAIEASKAAAAEDHTLQLPDLGVILLGYLMMSAMVFTWRAVVCAVCQRAGRALPLLWGRVVRVLEGTAAVVKVGLLLSLKMLFLPLLLGLWLDAATQPILGPGFDARVRFATENLVGALLLHWVAGISFMLAVTVSVLQLREVLHPRVLARVIRPQEPQPDLLGSLLQEPGLTHARRMVMSLAIYVALLGLFVWLPARALPRWLLGARAAEGLAPFQPRTCYLAPQLQIPLELILFHLAMLAFLEHAKGGIGRLQHLWLRPLCAALGLTRLLLPVPRIRRPHYLHNANANANGNGGALWPDPDEPERFLIGRPLRRPPRADGWEAGGGGGGGGGDPDQGRWAWGNEPLSAMERALAPPRKPLWCLPRLAVLLVCSWAAVLALVLGAAVLPLLLGRAAFALLHIPPRFGHDPLAFAIGVALCWGAHKWATRLQQRITPEALDAWVARAKTSRPTLRQLGTVAAFFLVWTAASPLLLGVLFELALVTGGEGWAGRGVRGLHLGQDWLLGLWLCHELAYLGYLGVLDRVWGPIQRPPPRPLEGLEGQPPPATYQAAICVRGVGWMDGWMDGWMCCLFAHPARSPRRSSPPPPPPPPHHDTQHTLSSLQAVFLQWDWSKATPQHLLSPFTLPLAASLLEAIALPTAVALALPALREHYPRLVIFLPPADQPGGLPSAELQVCGLCVCVCWGMGGVGSGLG
jgi:hypothetical protein